MGPDILNYGLAYASITLLRSITMFSGTNNIPKNIPVFIKNIGNVENIPWKIVNPIEHCYEFE